MMHKKSHITLLLTLLLFACSPITPEDTENETNNTESLVENSTTETEGASTTTKIEEADTTETEKNNTTETDLEDDSKKPTTWNFLVYMAADNNLEGAAIEDINEMELIGSSEQVRVFALIDRAPGNDTSNGDWTSTRLYHITKDPYNSQNIVSTLIEDYGELDTSDPTTLANFIQFTSTNYPADRTVLTLWNHGSGVQPRSTGRVTRAIAEDITTQNIMYTSDILEAITLGSPTRNIDILNFDACLMQMFEIGWELSSVTGVITGSQSLVPGDGNDYTSLLTKLSNAPEIGTEEFATYMVDDFYNQYNQYYWDPQSENSYIRGISYSALDSTQLESLKSKFLAITELITTDPSFIPIARTIRKTETSESSTEPRGGNTDYIDLIDFFTTLANNESISQNVRIAILDLLPSLQATVINHRALGIYAGNGTNPLNGVSINLPTSRDRLLSLYDYRALRISKDTHWDTFMEQVAE